MNLTCLFSRVPSFNFENGKNRKNQQKFHFFLSQWLGLDDELILNLPSLPIGKRYKLLASLKKRKGNHWKNRGKSEESVKSGKIGKNRKNQQNRGKSGKIGKNWEESGRISKIGEKSDKIGHKSGKVVKSGKMGKNRKIGKSQGKSGEIRQNQEDQGKSGKIREIRKNLRNPLNGLATLKPEKTPLRIEIAKPQALDITAFIKDLKVENWEKLSKIGKFGLNPENWEKGIIRNIQRSGKIGENRGKSK